MFSAVVSGRFTVGADTATCLLFWEAQIPLAQVQQDWLVGFCKPAMNLILGEAGPQPSQIGSDGLVQAGQHQCAQQLVLHQLPKLIHVPTGTSNALCRGRALHTHVIAFLKANRSNTERGKPMHKHDNSQQTVMDEVMCTYSRKVNLPTLSWRCRLSTRVSTY